MTQAAEKYGDVSDRLKASGQTFEQSKQNAAEATHRFNQVKQNRQVHAMPFLAPLSIESADDSLFRIFVQRCPTCMARSSAHDATLWDHMLIDHSHHVVSRST